jgi:hypothetical protein
MAAAMSAVPCHVRSHLSYDGVAVWPMRRDGGCVPTQRVLRTLLAAHCSRYLTGQLMNDYCGDVAIVHSRSRARAACVVRDTVSIVILLILYKTSRRHVPLPFAAQIRHPLL